MVRSLKSDSAAAGKQQKAATGAEDVQTLMPASDSISSAIQTAMDGLDLSAIAKSAGDAPFSHYYDRVDIGEVSPLVTTCISGYSEGMLRTLSKEDIRDILLYDETLGVEISCNPRSPDWLVYCTNREMLERPINWAKRAGFSPDSLHLYLNVDEESMIHDEEIRAYWAETGISAEHIFIRHVDTEIVSSTESPWGEGCITDGEYDANWLYWYWRGQKDQLALMTGDPAAWKKTCAKLDEMINAEAEEFGFDPWLEG